jgi:hypothetical protein
VSPINTRKLSGPFHRRCAAVPFPVNGEGKLHANDTKQARFDVHPRRNSWIVISGGQFNRTGAMLVPAPTDV